MVSLGYVVKFGDFGMVWVMYDLDYYRFGWKGMNWVLDWGCVLLILFGIRIWINLIKKFKCKLW